MGRESGEDVWRLDRREALSRAVSKAAVEADAYLKELDTSIVRELQTWGSGTGGTEGGEDITTPGK
jgi:hypothetical protein